MCPLRWHLRHLQGRQRPHQSRANHDEANHRTDFGLKHVPLSGVLRNALVEACKVGTVLLIEDGLMEVKVTEQLGQAVFARSAT